VSDCLPAALRQHPPAVRNRDGTCGRNRTSRTTTAHRTLKLDVPGLSEKDFEITANNNVLTVRGERKLGNGFKQEHLAWTERPCGTFTRSFTLPHTVDMNSINATYTNGVLQIVFAKRAEAKPKQIPVKFAQKD
jgi:HSP20 family protein